MTHRATGIGSQPGTDIVEATQIVFGETGDLPYLPELPARGAPAGVVGRTLALVSDIGIDLQPAGWRLTDGSGVDHRRAVSLLARDLDAVEEQIPAGSAAFKVQLAGPWTLAAAVERPRGDKVLADHGARRDLAQALAEGLTTHLTDVRRRTGVDELVVQLDEPSLPAVLEGRIPTASGFGRHRSVAPAEAAAALDWLVDVCQAAGAVPVLHCCAPTLPWPVLRETQLRAVSFDLAAVGESSYDDLAAWADAGRELWPGVVPALEPSGPATGADLTRQVLGWWSDLGFSDLDTLPPTTVTPGCGLAGATPRWARTAHELATVVARNLSVEQGSAASRPDS